MQVYIFIFTVIDVFMMFLFGGGGFWWLYLLHCYLFLNFELGIHSFVHSYTMNIADVATSPVVIVTFFCQLYLIVIFYTLKLYRTSLPGINRSPFKNALL